MPTYRNLDKTPRIFFLPGDQIFPWIIISTVSYFFVRKVFGLSWVWVLTISGWGIGTWWVLTWKGMHYFFGRLVSAPHWVRAIVEYKSVLNHGQSRSQTSRRSRWQKG